MLEVPVMLSWLDEHLTHCPIIILMDVHNQVLVFLHTQGRKYLTFQLI